MGLLLRCFHQQQSILWRSLTVALLTFFFFFFCSNQCLGDLNDDTEGLKAFYNAFNAPNLLQWNNASASVCVWQGVECRNTTKGETRVFFLRLARANLIGAIPPTSLSRVTELRVINLHSNQISGPIPEDLSNCAFLRSIYLQRNRLVGPLPSNFSKWRNLVHLDLSFNGFNGSISSSITNLTQLKSLYLQNNSLSGAIPPIDIATLRNFSVAYNNLSGPVPSTPTLDNFLSTGAFLGNAFLCGSPPLLPACPSTPSPAPAPSSSQPPPSPNGRKKKLSKGEIAGIVIGCLALLLILVTLVFLACRRKDQEGEAKAKVESRGYVVEPPGYASTSAGGGGGGGGGGGAASEGLVRETGGGGAAGGAAGGAMAVAVGEKKDLVFFDGTRHLEFSMEELLRASAEVLGKGSVGTAYKAVLESGLVVAVKRLKDVSMERSAFQRHLDSVGHLSHPNLVPLLAYYYASDEKLLVTEYMPNGSLSALLHGNKGANRTPLDWDTRMKIAAGAALGLEYLHDEGIVHGNIKSSNILLTKDYTACVSDYGVTQLVSATPAAVNRILGYRAPEVTDIRRVGPRADVYSFGVLLIELLTGKAPVHASPSDEDGIDLPRWVQSVAQEEWSTQVFDKELMKYQGNIEEEMVGMLHIAQQCVAPSPDQRTPIKQVVKMIKNLRKE